MFGAMRRLRFPPPKYLLAQTTPQSPETPVSSRNLLPAYLIFLFTFRTYYCIMALT